MRAYFLPVLSGIFLGLSFLHPSFGLLIFIAFSPLFLFLKSANTARAYRAGLTTGIIAFLIANHWIYNFSYNLTSSHWQSIGILALYIVYSAHGVCLFAIGVMLLRRNVTSFLQLLSAPLFGTAIFSAYPYLFDFSLSATQAGKPEALSLISLSGHWGLNCFILLINFLLSFLFHSIQQEKKLLTVIYTSVLFGSIGLWLSISHALNITSAQPSISYKIGFHQPNDPPEITPLSASGHYSLAYTPAINNSYLLSRTGADVVIWPESRPKGLLSRDWVQSAYAAHARAMGLHLVTQDIGGKNQQQRRNYNSSIHLTPEGQVQIYNKVKRIPFGEYIPNWIMHTPLYGVVSSLFDGINKNIAAGEGHTLFSMYELRALPLICYEILDSQTVSKAIKASPDTNLILLQSNDAWFLSDLQAKMHNNFAILRAVEAQRPVLHITNKGPSYFINAQGDIVWQSSRGIAASFIGKIMVSASSTKPGFAVRHPAWFLQFAALISLITFMYIILLLTLNRAPQLRNL